MTSCAVHIIYCEVVPAGDGYTIILIIYCVIVDHGVIGGAKIEDSVRIVSGREASADDIWCITCSVIKQHVPHNQLGTARYAEEMCEPTLNIKFSITEHAVILLTTMK